MEDTFLETRIRGPNFSIQEEIELINLISQYKHIILPGNQISSNQHKTDAFETIAKLFNQKGLGHERSADSLRIKWDKLKRQLNKKNGGEVNKRVHRMYIDYYGADSNELKHVFSDELSADSQHKPDTIEDESSSNLLEKLLNGDVQVAGNSDEEGGTNVSNLSPNITSTRNNVITLTGLSVNQKYPKKRKTIANRFSQAEIALLLQCIKKVKKDIFVKAITNEEVERKQRAWSRVADEFNKSSPTKRDATALCKKFMLIKNMVAHGFRSMTNRKNKRTEEHCRGDNRNENNTGKELKPEPEFDIETVDHEYFAQDFSIELENEEPNFKMRKVSKAQESHEDPLGNLQVRSIESLTQAPESRDLTNGILPRNSLDQDENPEIVKLKLELLKYQMETAKMERKRVENLVRVDEEARRSRSMEWALRLRAARLEAEAAASRLHPDHPALQFAPEETEAERYLRQFNVDND